MQKSGIGKDQRQQHYINTLLQMLEKQEAYDSDVLMPFLHKGNNEPSKSAIYYYVTISMLLQDKELDEMINYMLYDKCCKNDINFFTSSICLQNVDNLMADKRDTIKKVVSIAITNSFNCNAFSLNQCCCVFSVNQTSRNSTAGAANEAPEMANRMFEYHQIWKWIKT